MDRDQRNGESYLEMLANDDSPESPLAHGHGHKRTRHEADCYSDSDSDDENGDLGDSGEKVARSRERNREHARRTRLRKKALMQMLRGRSIELENEAASLNEALVRIQLAHILVEMSVPKMSASLTPPESPTPDDDALESLSARGLVYPTRFGRLDGSGDAKHGAPLHRRWSHSARQDARPDSPGSASSSSSQSTTTSSSDLHAEGSAGGGPADGRLHFSQSVNWKEGFVVDRSGARQSLSTRELDDLRRERNRMHAKMTRDRKKELVSNLERHISELEASNDARRESLKRAVGEGCPTDMPAKTSTRTPREEPQAVDY